MKLPEPSELSRMNFDGASFRDLAKRYGTTKGTIAGSVQRWRKAQEQEAQAPQPTEDTGERLEVNEDHNTREITATGRRITSLEQLLDFAKVDRTEWIVERHIINKWEVGRKAITKDLSFNGGTVSGDIHDTGGINVEPLIQVKVWLTRRAPEPIKPIIKPVYINITRTPPPPARTRGMKAALILPDTQFGFSRDVMRGTLTPFHDRRALDAVLQVGRVVQPETAVHMGDGIDFSGWSDKFIRRPEFYFTTQPALIEGAWFMRNVRELTSGEVYELEGNHDLRPEVQIMSHLSEAYGLRSADNLDAAPVMGVDNLLGLSRMGVTYVGNYPAGEVWLNETTKCIHGDKVKGQPGQTAAAVVRDANETIIFGHIHRRELATRTIPSRHCYRTVTAYSPGCLCHVDGRVPGSSKSNQWQQGAAVIWYDEQTSLIQPIDIYNGCAYFGGRVFEGVDYLETLRHDTGWNF